MRQKARPASDPLARVVAAGLLTQLLFVSPVAAATEPFGTVRHGKIEISVQNEELSTIVETIARASGATFLYDDTLVGRATITVGYPVSPSEALAVLDAALLMRGFAVLQAGSGIRKILPIGEGGSGAPLLEEGEQGLGDAPGEAAAPSETEGEAGPGAENGSSFLTTMVRMQVADAEVVAAKLQHLVGQARSALAYPPTNSLILVGTRGDLRRMIELARALDAGDSGQLLVRTLRYRTSDAFVELAASILEPGPGESPIELWSDSRTNSILALGTPDQLARTRSLAKELDVPADIGSPIGVIRILHRDAAETAEMLRAVGAGTGTAGAAASGEVLAGRSFTVVADPATNSLLVDGDKEAIAAVRAVVEELDRVQPQVLVEILALQISNPTTLALGIDWFIPAFDPGQTKHITTFLSNPSGGGLRATAGDDTSFFGRIAREPLVIPFVSDAGFPIDVVLPRETTVITADSREIDTRVLMRPRLVMSPGEEQELFVGDNIPVPVGAPATAGAIVGTQTNVDIQRQDVGIVLRVEPALGQAGKVQLKIDIETSRVGESVAGSVELVGPTIEKREVTTKVLLGDGELVVIGTTQQNVLQEVVSGTPFIRDIPLLGRLMESKRVRTEDIHVVFSVQARILRTPVEALADSIRERLAYQRSFERVRDLESVPGAPYALLVDTFETHEEAASLQHELEALDVTAQIGRWEDPLGPLHDVYVTGYDGLIHAGEGSRALLAAGYPSQVVVLPVGSRFASGGLLDAASRGYPLGP